MARILVIDDMPAVTGLLSAVLEGCGHAVVERNNGATGLAELNGGGFDLVVVDMMMPGLDGIEVVKRLRAAGHKAPVIAMSGGTDDFPASHSLKMSEMYGADRLLFKPFGNDELVAMVEQLLDS